MLTEHIIQLGKDRLFTYYDGLLSDYRLDKDWKKCNSEERVQNGLGGRRHAGAGREERCLVGSSRKKLEGSEGRRGHSLANINDRLIMVSGGL